MPYKLNLKIGSNEINRHIVDIISNGNYTHLQIGRSQNFVMRPGEVHVITQGPNAVLKNRSDANVVNGALGWNDVSGFKFEITIPSTGGVPKFTVNANDKLTYSITSNDKNTASTITHVNHTVGEGTGPGTDTNVYVGVFQVDDGPKNGDDLPWVFPKLEMLDTFSRTVSDISIPSGSNDAKKKWPIVVLSHGVRTEFDSNFPTDYAGTRHTSKPFLHMNPKFRNYDLGQGEKNILAMTPTQIGIRRPGGGGGAPVDVTSSGLGYYGGDFSAKYGTSYAVTHSLPFAPIFSLGAFQNAVANGYDEFGAKPVDDSGPDPTRIALLPSISHPIANSFAPSMIAKGKVRDSVSGAVVADHSYLANLALWDDYFFSSIAPVTTTSHKNASTAKAEQKAAFKAFADPSVTIQEPLPNPRMRPFLHGYEDAEEALFPSSPPAAGEEPYRLSGSMLTVDGAFNVNSMSIKAWTSFLMGLKDSDVPTLDPLSPTRPNNLENDTDTPVASLLGAAGGKIDETQIASPLEPTQWLGFRSLKDTQVESLAEEIVNQVREYGPFLSIADFVNRRPDGSTAEALVGPLQAAIDATDINAPYKIH